MKKLNITAYWEDSEYFDVEPPRYNFRAVCTSEICTKEPAALVQTMAGPAAIKNVAKTKTWCPDCQEALFWEKLKQK